MVTPGRLLALDVGDRRIGVATSDPTGTVVTPLGTITRKGRQRDLDALRRIVDEHQPERIVVGLPLSLSGDAGPQAQRVLGLVRELRAALQVPVDTWDERYSTVEAHEILRSQGLSARKHKERIDAVAAAAILESYLAAERHRHVEGADERRPPADPA